MLPRLHCSPWLCQTRHNSAPDQRLRSGGLLQKITNQIHRVPLLFAWRFVSVDYMWTMHKSSNREETLVEEPIVGKHHVFRKRLAVERRQSGLFHI
jgi:hypothetical protein